MRRRVVVVVLSAGLVLAGCGGAEDAGEPEAGSFCAEVIGPCTPEDETASTADPFELPPDTGSDAATEAGRTQLWPSGVRMTLVSVAFEPMTDAYRYAPDGTDDHDRLVRVVVELSNEGPEPRAFGGQPGELLPELQLLVGPDGVPAQGQRTGDEYAEQWPTRLAPGSSARQTLLWSYDEADGTELEITATPAAGFESDPTALHHFANVQPTPAP
jgi:hypothetical protein